MWLLAVQIVAYAAERCIEVVPEIELPGHCVAALAAYPHLSCEQLPTVLVGLCCLPQCAKHQRWV
jgi:N-acetyl-beta-hexosaminidase